MSIEKFIGSFEKEDLGCTIIVNETIRYISDPAVLGVYCYLLTKPITWDINALEIMRHFKMSKDKTYRILNDLMDLFLLSRTEIRMKGRFIKFHYKLHLKPYAPWTAPENNRLDSQPFPEKQDTVNQDAYKTKILEIKDTTTSEFTNSPIAATPAIKQKPNCELMELINIYRTVFPDNPQPHKKVIATSLRKTLQSLIKQWPELDPNGKQISYEAFRRYLEMLKSTAPKFALGQYQTADGNWKKNGLETFCRLNTIVKFLEGSYS